MPRSASVFVLALLVSGCVPGGGSGPASRVDQPDEPDADGDGVPDAEDNCVRTRNASQTDRDDNGWGDLCETSGPDVVVMTFSGHDPLGGAYNSENLGTPGGTGDVIAGLFQDAEVWSYRDELYSVPDDGVHGFIEAWNDGITLTEFQYSADWVPLERPTRLIVVAHSHGTNWSHLWANNQHHLTIDVLIDLDGVSWAWEAPTPGYKFVGDDWGRLMASYEAEYSTPWTAERTFSDVTGNWLIGGVAYDEKDTFDANTLLNLEVWSDGSAGGWPVDIRDEVANRALDGSGRERSRGCYFDEAHDRVDDPASDGMAWVLGMVEAVYFGGSEVGCPG